MTITPYTFTYVPEGCFDNYRKRETDLLTSCLEQPDKHLPVNHAINILKSKLTILATL